MRNVSKIRRKAWQVCRIVSPLLPNYSLSKVDAANGILEEKTVKGVLTSI